MESLGQEFRDVPEEMNQRKEEAVLRGKPRENGATGCVLTGGLKTKIHQPERSRNHFCSREKNH